MTGNTERISAATLPDDDVIKVLLDQHARIKELFSEVRGTNGEHKQQAFDELRALLAVHETAEEMVLRPAAKDTAGAEEAEARNSEEQEANKVLARLEKMDVGSAEFDTEFAKFENSVLLHAEREELEEFPAVHQGCGQDKLEGMGRRLRTVEKFAPTHPHPMAAGKPMAQWTVGPFASVVDRTRDALSSSG